MKKIWKKELEIDIQILSWKSKFVAKEVSRIAKEAGTELIKVAKTVTAKQQNVRRIK